MADTSTIQADFDRIALISGEEWNHNSYYHDFLLAHVPARCEQALDIGCGTGVFARLLAERADRVLSLDLSPQMIRLARERSQQYPNVDFQIADVTKWAFPQAHFDCIASIATFHRIFAAETPDNMSGEEAAPPFSEELSRKVPGRTFMSKNGPKHPEL